ncbi:hypothetical protein PPYR_10882 [Photinus pyralis]|uniref:CHK kinase-like domain-containing protein n=1 Tax=Photinus pyralis TaxID=7054 RepID=A0A5N4AHN7_PHOPY|nr:uncharacterized protein LOC116173056 [Photinus pyralis]XP_031352496.1 uncharacterized protein LOC116177627 [Photinus pyralis]KAB0796821.1 hypothetical protein PPYR_10882 [Photinus pyralis]
MSSVTAEIENLARSLVTAAFPDRISCPIEISNSALENGDNFLGLIYNVSVSDDNGTIHLVVKLAPQEDYFRIVMPVREIYKTEIFAYKEILCEFSRIQDEKKLPRDFQAFARMYASRTDNLRESLLMENVKKRGFRLINHRIPVDYPHASLVMREMGRFHALSYAIRDQKPEIFDSWEDQCHEYFFSSSIQVPALKGITRLVSAVVNSYPPHQREKERRALKEFAGDLSTIYKSGLVVSSDDKKYAVVAHGDMELRNLLFKYGHDPEHPTELCILDWQMMHLASPALDVLFFLFLSSDGELRKQYYTKLIDEYYDSLSSFLRELGSDPEVLLPFPILLEHLRKLSGFVLLIAIWLLATNMKESDDVPDFSNIDSEDVLVTMISVVPKRGYLPRIRELVSDMIEFDYPFSKLVDQ